MRHPISRNYWIIHVMLWSFPYLLWQAFGHWSGFLVGLIVSVILTAMFNSLSFSQEDYNEDTLVYYKKRFVTDNEG